MAMTIEEISGIFTRAGIKHQFYDGDIVFSFETDRYTNPKGDKGLLMFASLPKEGTMFTLTAHFGFMVKGNPHLDNFLKLCTIIQMVGYSIQFEYVPQNGTVRPCIEVPLMDNKLTRAQLMYCVTEMVRTVDAYYPALQKVLETGEFPDEVQSLLDDHQGNGDTDRL